MVLNQPLKGTAAAITSGILLYFGTGLHPIWGLTWIAPIPVLLFAAQARAWAAFLAAFAAWLGGITNEFAYAHDVIGIPLGIVMIMLLTPSLVFACSVLLWRFCVCRRAYWQAVLALPCAWVGYEFLNAATSPHGTFGSIAYSQMDCLPVLQLAALTGIWGIAFMLVLIPSTAAVIAANRGAWKVGLPVLAATLGVIAFGAWRLQADLHATGTLRVALIGSDARQDNWAKDDPQALDILRRYAAQIEGMPGAQVIVLPEDLGPISPAAGRAAAQILSQAAQHSGAELVVGLRAGRTPPMLNEALVFSRTGAVEQMYEKHHLIPGIEAGIMPGGTIATMAGSTGVEGVQICKDLDFPELSREYSLRNVGLLLVPAFDFDVDRWLHGRMAVMRGVESGFSIARAARHGLLTASDNRGRILVDRSSSPSGFVAVMADVPVAHADTLYARYGDWFAWVSIVLLMIALGSALFHRVRRRPVRRNDLSAAFR